MIRTVAHSTAPRGVTAPAYLYSYDYRPPRG